MWFDEQLARLDAWRRTRSVATDTGSIVRIAAWTLAFLALPALLPFLGDGYNPAPEDAHVMRMRTLMGDPRAFRAAGVPSDADAYHVAWIAGSASFVYQPDGDVDLLPRRVALSLASQGVNQPRVLSYVNAATRLYDRYLCLQDALHRDPQAIVLALTSRNLLAPRALAQMRYQYPGALARLPAAAPDLAVYAILSQPSDWLQGIAIQTAPLLRDQAGLHRYPRAVARLLHPINDTPSAATVYDDADTATPYTGLFLERASHAWPLPTALRANTTDADPGLNHWALSHMVDQLATLDGAALVYLEPLAPGASDPARDACVRLLESLADRHARPGFRIVTTVPASALSGAHFKDDLHFADPGVGEEGAGKFPEYLATTLLEIEREVTQ
jgi:hypothetical protein